MWSVYAMEYCLAIPRSEEWVLAATLMDLEILKRCERSRETENPTICCLPSCRTREAGGIVHRPESPRGTDTGASASLQAWEPGMLRAGEDEVPHFSNQTEGAGFQPPRHIVEFWLSTGCMLPTHTGEGHLLYPIHHFKWSSLLETPLQTHPEIIFN